MPPSMLKNMKIDEISLVDAGANPGAKVALFKRKAIPGKLHALVEKALGKEAADKLFKQAMTYDELEAAKDLAPMLWTLSDSLNSIMSDSALSAPAKVDKLRSTFDEFLTAYAGEVAEDDVSKAFRPCGDCQDATACEKTGKCAAKEKANMDKDSVQKMIDEAVAKATETVTKALETSHKAALEAVEKKAADDLAKANAAVEATAKVVKAMQESADEATRLAKARDACAGLADPKPEDVAKSLAALSPEAGDALLKSIKAIAAQAAVVQKALVTQAGVSVVKAGSAMDQLNQKAAELRKSKPEMTEEQAFAQVTKANGSLYAQSLREAN